MDLDRVEKLVHLFGRSRAQELVVEADGWHVALRRAPLPAGAAPPAPLAPDQGSEVESELAGPLEPLTVVITAPRVGIFRQSDVPLAAGDRVEPGALVGSIESMKILNPVLVEVSGEIVDMQVEDGHPVEYGEPLCVVLPSAETAEEENEP